MISRVERLLICSAVLYVLVLGWAMVNISYDLWGAFVLLPVLVLATLAILRRVFPHEYPGLYRIAVIGLVAKFGVVFVRYFIAFQSYSGFSDSGDYDLNAKVIAGNIRSGVRSPLELIPRGTGTQFIEHFLASNYVVIGASRLAGFFVFAWLAYWGTVMFMRAAMIAVPGLDHRRYAYLMFLLPSVLYWPASIGKEALIYFGIGIASIGVAHILAGRWSLFALLCLVGGLVFAGMVRPHFAAMWVGGLVVALIAGLFKRRSERGSVGRFGTVVFILVALVALGALGAATLKFLDQRSNTVNTAGPVTSQIIKLFAAANTRTDQGGSSFRTISINGPLDWPFAIVRTLTRPLLNEARSFAELIPAAEMTILILLAFVNWRRLFNLFPMMRRSSYVVFAVVVTLVFGLAFSSIGNLGLLTRQRSLVMPLFVLPFAFPTWVSHRKARPAADAGSVGSLRAARSVGTMVSR